MGYVLQALAEYSAKKYGFPVISLRMIKMGIRIIRLISGYSSPDSMSRITVDIGTP